MRARRTDERGAAAVEFALVSIVFFTLVFGIIQFGMWLWTWEQAAHAAREASRYGAVHPVCTSQIVTKGEVALEGSPVTAKSVSVTGLTPAEVGGDITVTVTASPVDIGFFPSLTPSVTKNATSRIENYPGDDGGCP